MDHSKGENITVKQLREILESYKMEIGTGSPLLSNLYKIFKHCITNTWVSHSFKYMWKNNYARNDTTSNLTLDRENNVFIM